MESEFKGLWIPKDIWLDNRLNALEKCILVEIDSLEKSERGCFASNKHIANFCGCSETKVSTTISKLIKLGYVRAQSDGKQRELRICLSKSESDLSKIESSLSKSETGAFKDLKAAFKNLKESNIESNIESKKYFIPPTVEDVAAYCKDHGYTIDAQYFVDFYTSKGWMVGTSKMKDWKAAVRMWQRNDAKKTKDCDVGATGVKLLPENQRSHELDDIFSGGWSK